VVRFYGLTLDQAFIPHTSTSTAIVQWCQQPEDDKFPVIVSSTKPPWHKHFGLSESDCSAAVNANQQVYNTNSADLMAG
jgi:hypothetical protein